MMNEALGSFCAGTALGFSLGSPVEWTIHKYLLHAPPRLRRKSVFIENAARGHNDNHHGAYRAPEHYYRDVTNEHEIIHFAKSDVGLIAGISTVVGAGIDRAYALLAQQPSFSLGNAAFVSGVLTGTMAYYGCYEFFHHYMHVLGQRRLMITRALGDIIQGGIERRDGNLRLSKPLLDDICNAVEARLDENISAECDFQEILPAPALQKRLAQQIKENLDGNLVKDVVHIAPQLGFGALTCTYASLAEQERLFLRSSSAGEWASYKIQRILHAHLRTSPLFRYLDNHHYIHHRKYGANLNVLVPFMDYFKGTKENSTIAALESNTAYWLCPNSPDVRRFERKAA